ncbi:MAG: hypothetical protein A2934_01075 [Candidatus Sungbacteria bacterium RIFCSPLOWO2_01_FULL_47_10]|uniref:Radical SAM core domain-containing protein n=1 Tax=Candidatus Sungbacteria bacterium RIFCSPLOWO2_01_FULL_47_10 TaxID=1802276 RepID=A0A1G2L7C1_9BACT|nr:MAG: hypothetical protein A2934_01075 [Candidatus Sungbacteria bacterium RIFCSPLOWO2_01_FULL_47_10]
MGRFDLCKTYPATIQREIQREKLTECYQYDTLYEHLKKNPSGVTMALVNTQKNRERDDYSFANINLLGKCNTNCFFCLGLDLAGVIDDQNQLAIPFAEWKNFETFLKKCKDNRIRKIYITGQNTDSLMYRCLEQLIDFLHAQDFAVGLRTNGYLALARMELINRCELSAGYSIHTLSPVTNRMIMGRDDLPDWDSIIPATQRPRVSIVLNRCNKQEFFELLRYVAKFENVRYIQIRRVSTDTRNDLLMPDMVVYEEIYSQVRNIFPLKRRFATDAEVYEIYGKDVVFWRTIKTSVNSMNYFTDDTVSDMYFIVEGYLKYRTQC